MDAALGFIVIEREDASSLVAEKYRKNLFYRLLIDGVKGIWISQDSADYQALRVASDFLRSGGVLGIAPEGTRSRTGALIRAKTGVAYLADKAQVPIVPVAITGTERFMHDLFRLHRPHLVIRFGEPFRLPPLDPSNRSKSLRRNTDEIMCRIAAMLPEKYRGVYAEHPRLGKLLTHSEP
jgi:1-acyl-sn-glycerol-3-phosphate acyltransferase